MHIDNNLLKYRIAKNMSVHELSRKSEVHHSTITNIENNNPQNVTLITAWLLSKALGVCPFDLFVIKK